MHLVNVTLALRQEFDFFSNAINKFLPRDAMLARYMPSSCVNLSFCHKSVFTETAKLKPRLHDTVWQLVECLYTWYNRLLNRFDIWLDNRLYRVYKHPTGCQTGCQTGLTTGWMFVYTMQPVVELVWQPVWQQPVVSCKRGFRITQTTPHDSPGSPVFWCRISRQNSNWVTPNGVAKCKWGMLQELSSTWDGRPWPQ